MSFQECSYDRRRWFLFHKEMSPFPQNLVVGGGVGAKCIQVSHFKDFDKRIRTTQTRGLEVYIDPMSLTLTGTPL